MFVRGSWEDNNLKRLLSLKATAEMSAQDGQLDKAASEFNQMFALLIGHEIERLDLQSSIREAHTEAERVKSAIAAKQQAAVDAKRIKREAETRQKELAQAAKNQEEAKVVAELQQQDEAWIARQAAQSALRKQQAAKTAFLESLLPVVDKARALRARLRTPGGTDYATLKQEYSEFADSLKSIPSPPEDDRDCANLLGSFHLIVQTYSNALDDWTASNQSSDPSQQSQLNDRRQKELEDADAYILALIRMCDAIKPSHGSDNDRLKALSIDMTPLLLELATNKYNAEVHKNKEDQLTQQASLDSDAGADRASVEATLSANQEIGLVIASDRAAIKDLEALKAFDSADLQTVAHLLAEDHSTDDRLRPYLRSLSE